AGDAGEGGDATLAKGAVECPVGSEAEDYGVLHGLANGGDENAAGGIDEHRITAVQAAVAGGFETGGAGVSDDREINGATSAEREVGAEVGVEAEEAKARRGADRAAEDGA